MKQSLHLKLRLTTLLFCLVATISSLCAATKVGNIYYEVEANGTATVVAADNVRTISVPSTITVNGVVYTITTIGFEAFKACTALETVTLPEGLTTLGTSAFNRCFALTSVEIPNSVTSIGNAAFYICSSLKSVKFPESLKSIGEAAFYACESLETVELHEGLVSIGISVFEGCIALTSINLPTTMSYIGESAFYGCESLVSVDIPEGITAIEDWTFGSCNALSAVTIPDAVTVIGHGAFNRCSSLPSVDLPSSLTAIGNAAFYKCESLTAVEIPEGVTTIGTWAFTECTSLESVTLKSTIGGRTSLGNMAAPESATIHVDPGTIGGAAFQGCTSLTHVELADGVTTIEEDAFDGVVLDQLSVPESVTSLANNSLPVANILYFYNNIPVENLFDALATSQRQGQVPLTVYVSDEAVEKYKNALDDKVNSWIQICDVASGIDRVNEDADNGPAIIYDITGRRVDRATNAGIYIINGVKTLIN